MPKDLAARVFAILTGGVPTSTAPCLISFAVDPTGAGVAAPVGSIGSRTDVPSVYVKTAVGDTAWTLLALVANTTPLLTGDGYSVYANGVDGDLVFDGVATVPTPAGFAGLALVPAAGIYSLDRDIFAHNMTVDAGVRIVTNAFRIFVQNTLTNNGAISLNGGHGANGTAGAGGAAGAVPGTGSGFLYSGLAGIAGGDPTFGAATGLAAATSHIGSQVGPTLSGANGGILAGGGGGSNDLGNFGGDVLPMPTANQLLNAHHFYVLSNALTGRIAATPNSLLEHGSCGGVGLPSSTAANGGAGGSGAVAGLVIVCARLIVGGGSIEARGGNGGNGGPPNAGGSGGGGGGVIVLATDSAFPISNLVTVAGGIGGLPGFPSLATAGGNGGSGLIYQFNP